mmetsp:Transcript_34680/g.92381  ORF Transcript_34680/g.92381 Transcript_34680/m.92381 type:complete len:251 (-) Transcript_34680:159-911(-)
MQRFQVRRLHAINELEHQNTACGHDLVCCDDSWYINADRLISLHIRPDCLRILRLVDEVELFLRLVAPFTQYPPKVELWLLLVHTLGQIHDVVEVLRNDTIDPSVLNFQCNLASVVELGSMHGRDAGGRDCFIVECHKEVLNAPVELSLDCVTSVGERPRRHGILQLLQFLHPRIGYDIGASRHELPELNPKTLELENLLARIVCHFSVDRVPMLSLLDWVFDFERPCFSRLVSRADPVRRHVNAHAPAE